MQDGEQPAASGHWNQKGIAERGYTAHESGMYSDKFIHPKVQTDAGRYISIGDPYKETAMDLPKRWKDKQMMVPGKPTNAGAGYFGLMGRAFDYMPDKYVEQLPYGKREPYATRKLGFGTHDASKRDEFCQRIRTEQYRDLLKREKRLLGKGVGSANLEARLQAGRDRLAADKIRQNELRQAVGLDAPKFLYDVGRSRETKFDPKMHRDKFYNTHTAHKREMRRGGYRTASQDIGNGAWAVQRVEHFGRSHATRAFYTQSHLEVQDI